MFGWTNNRPGSGENGAIGSGKQNWASWLKKKKKKRRGKLWPNAIYIPEGKLGVRQKSK